MSSKSSNKLVKQIKEKTHRIYGIFDFKLKTLVSVDLDQESIELKYDLQNYDESRFKIVTFEVMLY